MCFETDCIINNPSRSSSIVHSKLDYCNSPHYNLPISQINRLQQIQNCLARTVVKAPKSSLVTPILRSLHWLKINERIEYKLLSLAFKQSVLVYKCLHGSAPAYLTDELCQVADVEARQRLCSSSSSSLIVNRTRLYCRWPSFPGRRCTCLGQSAWSCHFRTFCSSLPVPD